MGEQLLCKREPGNVVDSQGHVIHIPAECIIMYLASMPNDTTGLPTSPQNRLLLEGLIKHYNMFSVYVCLINTLCCIRIVLCVLMLYCPVVL